MTIGLNAQHPENVVPDECAFAKQGRSLTFNLSEATLLLLGVLFDPAQVVQLCLQELALAQCLLLEVALLG